MEICLKAVLSMPERDRPPYLPQLSDPWPRPPEFVPQPAPAGHDVVDEPSTTAIAAPPVDAGGMPVAAVGEAAPNPEHREAERLTLLGRVGRDPTFWTTKNGVARAHFPLGVRHNPASDKTTWHRIDAWSKWAERARDTVSKGQVVEIVAYRRVTTVEGPRAPRQVEELRAAAIRHPDKQ
jgi:hypothetical protein